MQHPPTDSAKLDLRINKVLDEAHWSILTVSCSQPTGEFAHGGEVANTIWTTKRMNQSSFCGAEIKEKIPILPFAVQNEVRSIPLEAFLRYDATKKHLHGGRSGKPTSCRHTVKPAERTENSKYISQPRNGHISSRCGPRAAEMVASKMVRRFQSSGDEKPA